MRSRRPLSHVAFIAASALVAGGAIVASPAVPSAQLSALWEEPKDLSDRDLFYGPWGREHAPDPEAIYVYVRPKRGGINPGLIVRDPAGREWHVKQSAPDNLSGAEGPVEVVLSRVLSAVGYHQPPVYFLPSFRMKNAFSVKTQAGGRFRLTDDRLKDRGAWDWLDNPFAHTRELRGLLVVLLVFNSSDLKNSNNSIYDVTAVGSATQWFVVRDIGTALGETARVAPRRNNPALLGKNRLIAGIVDGYVRFNYHGLHQEIVTHRITADDVVWGCTLLSRLTDDQWRDAFRAGGYGRELSSRFIEILHARINEGLHVADAVHRTPD